MKLFKLLAFLAILTIPSIASAEGIVPALVIELKDGSVHRYEATEKPIVTFSENAVVISTGIASSEYSNDEFARFYFQEATSSIEEIAVEEPQPTITIRYIDEQMLQVSAECDGQIRVFGINGALVLTETLCNGTAIIDMSSISAGIYIININNQSIKFRKK